MSKLFECEVNGLKFSIHTPLHTEDKYFLIERKDKIGFPGFFIFSDDDFTDAPSFGFGDPNYWTWRKNEIKLYRNDYKLVKEKIKYLMFLK